ncbi:glycosyltransferase [Caldisericum sp.]|uniref:glycosyltransferase n=1 Tax=Caldisericum sp. TaxID=2499687 RepID=UPI003D0BF5EF
MNISIIIPTYKLPKEILEENLLSLYEFTNLDSKEVIVISNGQTKEVNDFLKSLDWIRPYFYDKPLGFSKAINEGIKVSRGEYIILLNDDNKLLPQFKDLWVGYLHEPFLVDSKMGITGPLTAIQKIDDDLEIEFVLFFCAMIKKEVFYHCGLLDEGFGLGGYEDIDFCYRAQKHGFHIARVPREFNAVYAIDSEKFTGMFPIYHEGSYTMQRLENANGLYERNFERLKSKILQKGEGFPIGRNDPPGLLQASRYKFAKEICLKFINQNKRKPRILDLGCGSGSGTLLLEQTYEEYLGIDYDENIIKFATIDFANDNTKFQQGDITDIEKFNQEFFDNFDIILCFETFEHLDNFYPLYLEMIKSNCELLISVPYKEKLERKWWAHKHWDLEEKHFKINEDNIRFYYQSWDGFIYDRNLDDLRTINTLFVNRPHRKERLKILAYIVTRNRFATSLPMTIMSLIQQSRIPDKIVLINDGENSDWINWPIYQMIIQNIYEKGIGFEFRIGEQKGQVNEHQKMNKENEGLFDFLWRIDDDEIASYNVLEEAEKFILGNSKEKIGAVGFGCYLPNTYFDKFKHPLEDFAIKLEDIHLPNIQFSNYDYPILVEHLHSTFLYKPGLADYPNFLSRVGHREETIFTYDIYKKGYKLYALPYLVVYHYQNANGGIREEKDAKLWSEDDKRFILYLKDKYKINIKPLKLIILENGLGDLFAFKQALPYILRKNENYTIYIGVDRPDVFWDIGDLKFIRVATARRMVPNPDDYNVYRFMAINKWDKSIVEAYKRLYG